jgi:ADP-heptose:LPS heptosyltransferase
MSILVAVFLHPKYCLEVHSFWRLDMGSRAGVFCHNGLGDGVVSLVLSNNLHLNGWQVDTYQNMIGSMQNWFPHLPILCYPEMDEIEQILHRYQWIFVFQNDTSEFIQKLISEGKRRCPDRVKVIYVAPSKRIVLEPYYQDTQIDPERSVIENLRFVCEKILHLPKSTNSNGIIPPQELQHRVYKRRVIIHPTSARPGRNWPKEKFLELAYQLRYEEFDPIWAIGPNERQDWQDLPHYGFEVPFFSTLDALSRFIYESGYLLGNDSGLGHLASCLGVPTLTISRRKTYAKLWAPSFTSGIVVAPNSLIPNISGFRLRDRYWKHFISTEKVLHAFDRLVAKVP